MKKLFAFLLISLFLVGIAYAQLDNLPQDQDEAKDVATSYLKQEWTKIFEGNQFGRFVLGVGKVFETLSPIFELLIGIEYSLSWLFFLSLGLWILVFALIYKTLKNVFVWNDFIIILIGVIIPTLAAQFDVFETFVGFFTPLFTNPLIILIAVFIGIILAIIFSKFMDDFGRVMTKHIKEEDEVRREAKSKTLERIHDIELKSHGHR